MSGGNNPFNNPLQNELLKGVYDKILEGFERDINSLILSAKDDAAWSQSVHDKGQEFELKRTSLLMLDSTLKLFAMKRKETK